MKKSGRKDREMRVEYRKEYASHKKQIYENEKNIPLMKKSLKDNKGSINIQIKKLLLQVKLNNFKKDNPELMFEPASAFKIKGFKAWCINRADLDIEECEDRKKDFMKKLNDMDAGVNAQIDKLDDQTKMCKDRMKVLEKQFKTWGIKL